MDKKLLRVRETPTVAIPLKHGGKEPLFCIGKFAIAEYSDGTTHKIMTLQESGVMTDSGIFVEIDNSYTVMPDDEIQQVSWQTLNNLEVFETSTKRFKRVALFKKDP